MCRFRSEHDEGYKTLIVELREAFRGRKSSPEATRIDGVPKKATILTVNEIPQENMVLIKNDTVKHGMVDKEKSSMELGAENQNMGENSTPRGDQITFPTYMPDDDHFMGREGLIKDIKPHLLSGINENATWFVVGPSIG